MRAEQPHWRRAILRLSGRGTDPAPETKSEGVQAAAVFRRFFYVLARLERREGRKAERRQP
jgi:hypothetical protein